MGSHLASRGYSSRDRSPHRLESVIFNALAEAHFQFYFSGWLRNTRIGTPESAQRWVREATFDIVSNPGLSKWWQRASERAAKINLGGRWDSEVNNEIYRLEQQGEDPSWPEADMPPGENVRFAVAEADMR